MPTRFPSLQICLPAILLLANAGLLCAADDPHIGPYIQGLRHDGVIVKWESVEKAAGEVDYGEGSFLSHTAREGAERTLHEVRIDGLRADTSYSYRIRWAGKTSGTFGFRTMPPPGSRRFRLAAYGDSRTNPHIHADIVRQMIAQDPDIVVHTGDLVADGTRKEQWKPQFFDPARLLLASKPVVTSLGNHERNARLYYEFFHYPTPEAWFSHRWANVHFIVLDSQQPFAPGTEQYAWLERELESEGADWRIAFFHYPMFSVHPTRAINENRWAWQDLFDRGGVDIVLTGHDHYYHRSHRIGRAWHAESEGVYHITTAGGGAPLYPVAEKVYAARAQSIHHFLVLDFDGKVVRGKAIGQHGEVIDSFVIDRTRPETTPYVSYEMILWEKALEDAAAKLPVEWLKWEEGRFERNFRMPAPLQDIAGSISYRWTGGSSFWAAGLCDGRANPAAGGSFELGLWGEGRSRSMFPLPVLELTIDNDPPDGREILNSTVSIQPLRLTRNREIAAPRLGGGFRIDGKLDEPAWERAAAARGFTRDYGRTLSEREEFRVAHDDAGLLIGARVRSTAREPLTGGEEARDASRMMRNDEAFAVALTTGGSKPIVFVLGANTRGTRYDTRSGDASWNPEWEFQAAILEEGSKPIGWQAEMRIPWKVLELERAPGESWRFNLLRWDREARTISEWIPTYTRLGDSRTHDGWIHFDRLAAREPSRPEDPERPGAASSSPAEPGR